MEKVLWSVCLEECFWRIHEITWFLHTSVKKSSVKKSSVKKKYLEICLTCIDMDSTNVRTSVAPVTFGCVKNGHV